MVHLLRWHQVQDEGDLGDALPKVKDAGLIPEDRVRLGVVCDGASWIWKHVQSLFPQARQVLDYDHCTAIIHGISDSHSDSPGTHTTQFSVG
jgi:hypothetical protein